MKKITCLVLLSVLWLSLRAQQKNVLITRQAGDYLFGPAPEILTDAVLSDLYGMQLKKVVVNGQVTAVVALFD